MMMLRILILASSFLLISCVQQETVTPATPTIPVSITEPPTPSLMSDPIKPPHTLQALTETLEAKFINTSIQIIKSPERVTLILPSYYVFINPHKINKFFKPDLQELIKILKIYQPPTIEIIGYTDNAGSFLQNMAISKEWANTIMKYLVKNDIPRENITVLAHGSLHPITANFTSAGRFQNRRVEISIYM